MIKQSLRQTVHSEIDHAEKYYRILSAINNLQLTNREIQLIAFTAVMGNIGAATFKDKFCEQYKTTSPTINNIISKLKRRKIFIKERKSIFVNPIIVVDFNKDMTMIILLKHAEEASNNVD